MITWSDILPALVQVFTAIAVDESKSAGGFTAEWKEGPRTAISDTQNLQILMKVTTCVGLGGDEQRTEYVPADSQDPDDQDFLGELRTTQVGQRKFTLQVQAIVPEHTDDTWAMAATERMRTRIKRQSSLDALEAVNVAIIDIKQATKVSFKDRGRVVSAATVDFILATAVNDVDSNPLGWFSSIWLTSHISDVDGIELPVPPNVVDYVSPPA